MTARRATSTSTADASVRSSAFTATPLGVNNLLAHNTHARW